MPRTGAPVRQSVKTFKQFKVKMPKMMAAAIKEQKQLTEENGKDPSVVNKYGAEHQATVKPTAQQTLTAGMMKEIATTKIQIAQLAKEEDKDAK